MKDNETLKACVEKAIENGWDINGEIDNLITWDVNCDIVMFAFNDGNNEIGRDYWNLPNLICDHSFMGAFYGRKLMCCDCKQEYDVKFVSYDYMPETRTCTRHSKKLSDGYILLCEGIDWMPTYQYHQQQLIILPPSERIAYLGRGVEGENDSFYKTSL
jgi:hypothetical protein